MNDANMFVIGATALIRAAANEVQAEGFCATLANAFCRSKKPTGPFLYETGQITSDNQGNLRPTIAPPTKRKNGWRHQR